MKSTTALSFDIVVTHDAEDLIHPEAFAFINAYADEYDMIQIPVLPLPTPLRDIVHGVYCDEFAEWQIKDMRVRQSMGSFVPSNGVGTGFTRRALEKLASAEHNLIFEPACLTEDYENGLRLHKLGCKQMFVPLTRLGTKQTGASIVATREFFPRTARSAIRQRSRWILGIGLQCWERNGWQGSLSERYWFWRDRKGLAGNPLSLLSNFVFLYGVLTWMAAHIARRSVGAGEVLTASGPINRHARDSDGPERGSHELLRAILWAGVCSRGPVARGMRQLDQHHRHLESRSLVCAVAAFVMSHWCG